MNKLIVSGIIVTGICLSTSLVSATNDDHQNAGTGSILKLERQELKSQAAGVRAKRKELHQENKDALKDFHASYSGAIKEMNKELTDVERNEIKKAHEERKNYIQSLSGLTLEQKAEYMSGMEDKIRHQIELRYAHASGALVDARMKVYTENAQRRAEALLNQLDLRAKRGAVKIGEIDTFVTKITAELPNLSVERKTKLAKKLDEKIEKIGKNKKIPDTSKAEVTTKLTALRDLLLK